MGQGAATGETKTEMMASMVQVVGVVCVVGPLSFHRCVDGGGRKCGRVSKRNTICSNSNRYVYE